MKREKIVCVGLAVVLAGTAAFGVSRELEVRKLEDRVESAGSELAAAREDYTRELESAVEERDALNAELAAVTGERDGLRTSLDKTRSELAAANAKIDEMSAGHPFDPEGPAYQLLYPDFYAPQPLDASQAPEKVIYLTFDDGPSARTDEILKILKDEGIHATFFIVGRTGNANRSRLRAIAEAGHTLGMHSYSHDYKMIYASVEAFLEDMYKVFTLIRDETGTAPTYFRFPGGSVNSYDYGIYEEITAEMLRRGFVPCDWNMSAQDATKTPLAADKILSNVLSAGNVARGVVLMHDSGARTTTVEALPRLIAALREKGYTFAPLTPEVKPVVFDYRKPALDG